MDRRKFLAAAGGAAALSSLLESPRILEAAPQAATELGKVKIRDVKTATIKIKYDAHLVKVTTDSGLYGIGEAYNRAGVVDTSTASRGKSSDRTRCRWTTFGIR